MSLRELRRLWLTKMDEIELVEMDMYQRVTQCYALRQERFEVVRCGKRKSCGVKTRSKGQRGGTGKIEEVKVSDACLSSPARLTRTRSKHYKP